MSTSSPVRPAPSSAPSGRTPVLLQVLRVARLEVTRIARGRGQWGRLALIGLPVLTCGLGAVALVLASDNPFEDALRVKGGTRRTPEELEALAGVFRFLVMRFVLFLATMELFANLFRAEVADRTLHHLFLSPVRREAAVVGKFVAALGLLASFIAASWALSMLLLLAPHGGSGLGTLVAGEGLRHLVRTLVLIALGVGAYGGVFLLLGLVFSKPLHVGVVLWLWEGLTTFLPQSVKRLTISHWLEALMPLRVTSNQTFARVADPESAGVALAVLLGVAVGCVALAAYAARRIELSYGKDSE